MPPVAVKKDSCAFTRSSRGLCCSSIAVFAQVLGWHWRSWLPGAEGVKSMTGGVKAAVYTFMSHLQ
jgi:hypothetical protein